MWLRIKQVLYPPTFEDQQQNQATFLMHGILLIMFVGVAAAAFVFLLLSGLPGFAPLASSTILALILLLAVSIGLRLFLQQGHVRAVGTIFSLALLIAVTANIRLNLGTIRNETVLAYPLIMLIATLVIGGRGGAIFTLASMSAITLLFGLETRAVMARPGVEPADLAVLLVYLLIMLVMGVILQFANRVIIGGLERSRSITGTLQELSDSLGQRVIERTRELELAAELGNAIAQFRDLDRLFEEGVELIRAQYDLYYVQIYLIDPSEQYLVLRVGTGTVGRELVEQGHRLPIGPGSINGTAAAERHAIIVADTSASRLFRPNRLLPNTRSEMSIPLISNRRLLGVLGLQADTTESFTLEDLPGFETLAGQLATAIENADLFAQTYQAQAELAAQSQRQTRLNWDAYLNAIERRENIGYEYGLDGVKPLSAPLKRSPAGHAQLLEAPIRVAGTDIGIIQLEAAGDRAWSPEQGELIQAVAEQVAQQVENLRLLDESERFRQEAEQTLRRFSREGWDAYLQSTGLDAVTYVYDGQMVAAVAAADAGEANGETTLSQDLRIRGEAIGEIHVQGSQNRDQNAQDLVDAVAIRLSAHIENLRLSQQTELALADVQRRSEELRVVNRVVSAVASSLDLTQSMQLVVDELAVMTNVDQVRVALFDETRTGLRIVAEHFDPAMSTSALGVVIGLEGNLLTQKVLATRETVVVTDAQNAPVTAPIHDLMREQGIETLVVMPMLVGNEVIGTIGMDLLDAQRTVTPDQVTLAETIVFQASSAAQNARLFEQLETALGESKALYEISQALVSGSGAANIVREVSDVLVREHFAPGLHNAALIAFELDADGLPVDGQLIGWHFLDGSRPPLPIGTRFLAENLAHFQQLVENPDTPIYFESINSNDRLDDISRFLWTDVNSAAVLPLRVANRWVGHLILAWHEARVVTEREKRVYRAIMGQIATTMDNQQLFQQTQTRAAELGVINQVAETVSQQLDMDRLLATVYGQIQRIMPVDLFHVGRYDEGANMISFLGLYEAGQSRTRAPEELVDGSETYEVLTSRRPILNNLLRLPDDDKVETGGERPIGDAALPLIVSRIHVPLGLGEKATGVLSVQSYEFDAYDQQDVTLLAGIATHLSVALDNADLFSRTQTALADAELQARRLAQLNDLAAAFGQAESLGDVYQIAAFQLNRILGGHRTGMTLLDEKSGELVVYEFEEEAGAVLTGDQMPLEGTSVGLAISENQLLYFSDLNDSIYPDHAQLREAGVQSQIVVPLLARSSVIGTLNVGSMEVDAYDAGNINLVRQISALMAAAIENRQLLARAQRQAERERLVNQINQKINSTVTMERAVQTAVEELGRALGVARAEVDFSLHPEPAGSQIAESSDRQGNGRSR